MTYIVQPMHIDDVDEVSRVEKECFTTPWPANAYRRELRENRLSRYGVVRWMNGESSASSSGHRSVESNVSHDAPMSGVKRAVSQLLRPFGILDRSENQVMESGILGFAGMWLMFDEAHITTIGVKKTMRGRGLGELLLIHLIEQSEEMGAKRLTLEVRVSNHIAQSLYRKYTFREEGVRKRYYSDDGEDALIMWSDRIDDPSFQNQLRTHKRTLLERIARAAPPDQSQSGDR